MREVYGFHPVLKPQHWYVCNFEKKRVVMIVFGCFTGYSLWTVVIRLHIYFTDWFFGGLGLELGLGVLVFEITKTTTPKLAVKFDLILGGKDRTKDNLTVRPLPKAGVALWPFFYVASYVVPQICHDIYATEVLEVARVGHKWYLYLINIQ